MNLAALRTYVRDLIRDNVNYEATAPDSQSALNFTDTQVTDAINYAIKLYSQRTGATFTFSSATVNANALATIPTDNLRIDYVAYGGQELVKSSAQMEAMKDDQWQARTGDAVRRWVPWSGSVIKLTPQFTGFSFGSSTVSIGYIQDPADLSAPADTVDSRIPLDQQEYLKYAAAGWLLLQMNDEQNIQLGGLFMNQFNELMKGVR